MFSHEIKNFDLVLKRRDTFINNLIHFINDKNYNSFLSAGCKLAIEETKLIPYFNEIYLVDYMREAIETAENIYKDKKLYHEKIKFLCEDIKNYKQIFNNKQLDVIYLSGMSDWCISMEERNIGMFPEHYLNLIKDNLSDKGICVARMWGKVDVNSLMKDYMEKEFKENLHWELFKSCLDSVYPTCLLLLSKTNYSFYNLDC